MTKECKFIMNPTGSGGYICEVCGQFSLAVIKQECTTDPEKQKLNMARQIHQPCNCGGRRQSRLR